MERYVTFWMTSDYAEMKPRKSEVHEKDSEQVNIWQI